MTMPDLTLCQNNSCPMKKNCYRYMAEPDPYMQSYSEFEYVDEKGKPFKCSYLMPIRPHDKLREIKDD